MKTVTAYISAENPRYQILPLRADNARMYQLLHDLSKVVVYPNRQIRLGQFVDRKTGYAEKSFRVAGIPLSEVIRLARIYGQESVVIEELGLLNANTLTYHPILEKYTGEEAYQREAFVLLEGMPAVSFKIDFKTTKRLEL
jgi:hypothetical protein